MAQAKLHDKTLVSIDGGWVDHHDDYLKKTLRAAPATFKDEKGSSQLVLIVGTDRIAGELKPGTTYTGRMFPSKGKYKLEWTFTVLAKENSSLQKPGAEYGGSAAPAGHQGSPAAQAQHASGSMGQRVGCVINNATAIAIAEMRAQADEQGASPGPVDLTRLDEIATALFTLACKLEGQQAPAGAGGQAAGHNQAMKEELMKAVNKALEDGGLMERFVNSSISEDAAIEVWTKCNANAMQFAIAISKMLADEPEMPGPGGDDGEIMPF